MYKNSLVYTICFLTLSLVFSCSDVYVEPEPSYFKGEHISWYLESKDTTKREFSNIQYHTPFFLVEGWESKDWLGGFLGRKTVAEYEVDEFDSLGHVYLRSISSKLWESSLASDYTDRSYLTYNVLSMRVCFKKAIRKDDRNSILESLKPENLGPENVKIRFIDAEQGYTRPFISDNSYEGIKNDEIIVKEMLSLGDNSIQLTGCVSASVYKGELNSNGDYWANKLIWGEFKLMFFY